MKWDNYGFAIASRIRKDVLLTLDKKPSLPSELTKSLNLDKSQVTRALRELEKKKLVVCLTPNNRKGKVYKISHEGRCITNKLK